MQMAASPGFIQRLTLHALQLEAQQFVGTLFNHGSQVGIGWATVWRVIFDAAVFRWVMRRGNHDAVCLRAPFTVEAQDSV
ncbi:hypothetical protein D3C75_1075420 [compost metagenome]